jgi:hypothetical protein
MSIENDLDQDDLDDLDELDKDEDQEWAEEITKEFSAKVKYEI